MTITSTPSSPGVVSARFVAAAATIALLLASITLLATTGSFASAAGTSQGGVTFAAQGQGTITSGGSGTFNMTPPANSACQGSGSSGYRWETFLVSASVDVGTLTFTSGPAAVDGTFVTALYDQFSEQVSTKFPATNPLGLISGIPLLSLPNTTGSLAVGSYKIGIACAFGGAIQEFWSTQIAVTANAADTPLGIAWTVEQPAATTSSTTTSTTVVPSATTTAPPGATTTAPPGATTTTTSSSSAATSTTTAIVAASSGTLTATGSSSLPLLVWALLLLALGRIAVLIARPVRMLPPRQR